MTQDSLVAARLVLLLLAGTALAAQAPTSVPDQDRPTEARAREALRTLIKGPLADKLGIVEFEKVDGITRDLFGVKQYTFEFSAVLRFSEDMLFSLGGPPFSVRTEITTAPPAPTLNEGRGFSWQGWGNTAVSGLRPAASGDRLRLNGSLEFVRYESGWRLEGQSMTGSLETAARVSETRSSSPAREDHPPSVSASLAPSAPPPSTRKYPVASGFGTQARITVQNGTAGAVWVSIDGAESTEVRRGASHTSALEVGSLHLVQANIGGQSFWMEFTVPNTASKIVVSDKGIQWAPR